MRSPVRWASEIAAPIAVVSVDSLVRWANEIAAPLAVVSVHSLVRWTSDIAAPLAVVNVPSLMRWANEFRCGNKSSFKSPIVAHAVIVEGCNANVAALSVCAPGSALQFKPPFVVQAVIIADCAIIRGVLPPTHHEIVARLNVGWLANIHPLNASKAPS